MVLLMNDRLTLLKKTWRVKKYECREHFLWLRLHVEAAEIAGASIL